MRRGLEGRRIAVVAEEGDSRAVTVIRALQGAGAEVNRLVSSSRDEDRQSAKYAGLVLMRPEGGSPGDPRVVHLVRECLVADKPLAAFGSAVKTVFEAGGLDGRSLSAGDDLKAAIQTARAKGVDEDIHVDGALISARDGGASVDEFAARVVTEFSNRLEERSVDEMSELSFPASDPPAMTPASIGHLRPDGKGDAQA